MEKNIKLEQDRKHIPFTPVSTVLIVDGWALV